MPFHSLTHSRTAPRDATDAQIHAAATKAMADGVIAKLEHGYETRVGERGLRLSGGEKHTLTHAHTRMH